MKQSAVEWLINHIDIKFIGNTDKYIEQAKEMEKQQIFDIFNELDNYCTGLTAEQYYNETFKNNG